MAPCPSPSHLLFHPPLRRPWQGRQRVITPVSFMSPPSASRGCNKAIVLLLQNRVSQSKRWGNWSAECRWGPRKEKKRKEKKVHSAAAAAPDALLVWLTIWWETPLISPECFSIREPSHKAQNSSGKRFHRQNEFSPFLNWFHINPAAEKNSHSASYINRKIIHFIFDI